MSMYRSEMPDREDFAGVVDSLLRLMDTYQIPPAKLVDGSFSPVANSHTMTGNVKLSKTVKLESYLFLIYI